MVESLIYTDFLEGFGSLETYSFIGRYGTCTSQCTATRLGRRKDRCVHIEGRTKLTHRS